VHEAIVKAQGLHESVLKGTVEFVANDFPCDTLCRIGGLAPMTG
jgi:hypothetical protein